MKKNLRCFFWVIFISILLQSLVAYDFPSESRQPLSFFGQELLPTGGDTTSPVACETGIVFSETELVRVSENATNLITIEKSNSLLSFPSVLGNALISQTDNGFQVIYGNLEDTSVLDEKQNILRFDTLARTNINPEGTREPLFFKIFDTNEKNKNFVNPLLFLPELEDKKAPEIRGVFLLSKEGQVNPVSQRMTLKSGEYTLLVETYDTIDNYPVRFSPFEITALVNGNTVADITFQTIVAQKGRLKVSDTVDLAELYSHHPYFSLGAIHLTEGNVRLSVSVRDYNRNRTEQNFEITITH